MIPCNIVQYCTSAFAHSRSEEHRAVVLHCTVTQQITTVVSPSPLPLPGMAAGLVQYCIDMQYSTSLSAVDVWCHLHASSLKKGPTRAPKGTSLTGAPSTALYSTVLYCSQGDPY